MYLADVDSRGQQRNCNELSHGLRGDYRRVMNRTRNAALALGVNVTKQTRDTDVRDLIERLKPIDCGNDLIRIGGDADGGYLLPGDLDGIEYCFSPGVGSQSEYESHLATLNIRSFLADYSIDFFPIHKPEFIFDKKFVGASDTETSFTLESWKNKYLPNYTGDLLLQMDIEGSEYEAIIATPLHVLNDFRIMVVEFHFMEKMFDPFVYGLYRACFEKILKNFHVVHIHPNNLCGSVRTNDIEIPRMMEFTFYNKRRVSKTKHIDDFPHPLGRDNVSDHESLPLPKCWYESPESVRVASWSAEGLRLRSEARFFSRN